MNIFFTTLIVGISLSMDAFSLALIYGTQGISRKSGVILSFIVGLFHFVMPLIGVMFGNYLFSYFSFDVEFIVGIIFDIIGLDMIISSKGDSEVHFIKSIWGMLLFGLSVSIDSLTTGIGLSAINDNYLEVSSIFMVVSGVFTYMGLRLGCILNAKIGKYSTILGGVILIILGVIYMF